MMKLEIIKRKITESDLRKYLKIKDPEGIYRFYTKTMKSGDPCLIVEESRVVPE
jgi:hypothetical protein